MINVAALWRHPIKSHGREAMDQVALTVGQTIPFDRAWAVMHEASKFDTAAPEWVTCANFMIGSGTPALAGIWAQLDEASGNITLTHQALGDIRFNPDDPADAARFLDWVRPLCSADKRQPIGLAKVPERGMTDTDYPSVSVMTMSSHQAVEDQIGDPLETARWRGNIWLDGAAAWQEMDWLGKTLRIGDAMLELIEPIKRCKHTMANPQTGARDADTLAALHGGWGHQHFGVYAKVIQNGRITLNEKVEVI
ncbi:MAG: hypothetical protein ACJAVT_001542 [Yoonia sp.]|jgi:uncharacterized protein YcbX